MERKYEYDSSSSEEDDLICEMILCIAMELAGDRSGCVTSFHVRDRLSFDNHVAALVSEGRFRNYYRMSLDDFYTLRDIIRPYIQLDYDQSNRRSLNKGPIILESIITMGIRYLAGGSYKTFA
jgi:hypothetical protein